MMSSKLSPAFGAALLLLLALNTAGCSSPAPDKVPMPNDTTSTPTSYVPRSGDHEHQVSPLAQLMRDMTAFADTTKQRIAEGRDLPPYPTHFKDMLTAEPTPGMVDHLVYDPFAFAYLHSIDSLYKAPVAARAEVYNAVVAGCANCHGQVCPGPLVRIKKLYAVE
ncbi:MAG TPA: hypothetical protein VGE21_09850 [Flavobacteriales bacterium]